MEMLCTFTEGVGEGHCNTQVLKLFMTGHSCLAPLRLPHLIFMSKVYGRSIVVCLKQLMLLMKFWLIWQIRCLRNLTNIDLSIICICLVKVKFVEYRLSKLFGSDEDMERVNIALSTSHPLYEEYRLHQHLLRQLSVLSLSLVVLGMIILMMATI